MHYISSHADGCRLECFTQNGVEYAILQNESMLVRICLTRGGDILELRYKKADTDILWHFVDACDGRTQVSSAAQPQGNFFTGYPGGWQEILPGGGPYENHGAKIGIHGEAALLPWSCDIVQDDAACVKITLRCTLRTVPFHIEI